MAIYRGSLPIDNAAIVSRHWFRDPRLSGKAKGYMGYIATHAPNYRLTIEQMIAEMRDGKDAVYAGLEELCSLDYLVRVQQRNDGEDGERRPGTFGEVDYHFGPAAAEPQYEPAWPPPEPTASGKTASGKPGSGRDQGKRGVSAGGTASGKSRSGRDLGKQGKSPGGTASGKSESKKEHKKEDLKEVTPVTATGQLPGPREPQQQGQDVSQISEPQTQLALAEWEEELALTLVRQRGNWRPSVLREVLTHPNVRGRPRELVELALVMGAADPRTWPRRFLHDGCPWWDAAWKQLEGKRHAGTPRVPQQPWCGRCAGSERRMVAPEELDLPPGKMVPCPRCHPDAALVGVS